MINTNMLTHSLFNIPNIDTYPPFKNGLYLEEYFIKKYNLEHPLLKRIYIPLKFTNFQIHPSFNQYKNELQIQLNNFVKENPSVNGYFTVIQYDDGSLLKLPENTIIYSACYYKDIPIPLIYEDKNNTLESFNKKSFSEKNILCSFVGTLTHVVRQKIVLQYQNNSNFHLINSGNWTPSVTKNNQDCFINTTLNSKFALAPRGYGLSSFRFYEIFLLGTIPIYVWDDSLWLPYQEFIDYSKFSIVINIKDINNLEKLLLNIDENQHNQMLKEYQNIKFWFTLDGMFKYIIEKEHISV